MHADVCDCFSYVVAYKRRVGKHLRCSCYFYGFLTVLSASTGSKPPACFKVFPTCQKTCLHFYKCLNPPLLGCICMQTLSSLGLM